MLARGDTHVLLDISHMPAAGLSPRSWHISPSLAILRLTPTALFLLSLQGSQMPPVICVSPFCLLVIQLYSAKAFRIVVLLLALCSSTVHPSLLCNLMATAIGSHPEKSVVVVRLATPSCGSQCRFFWHLCRDSCTLSQHRRTLRGGWRGHHAAAHSRGASTALHVWRGADWSHRSDLRAWLICLWRGKL